MCSGSRKERTLKKQHCSHKCSKVNQWHVTFIFSLKSCLKWILERKSCTANLLTYLRVNVVIKNLCLCSKPPCSKGKRSDLPEWMQIFILREHFGWRKCDLHKIWSAPLCLQQENIPEAFGEHTLFCTNRSESICNSLSFDTLVHFSSCWWLKSLLNAQSLSIACQLSSKIKAVLI